MSRRSRPHTVKVPQGATTVRIPRQRGHRAAAPVVVLVPEQPRSLSARAARVVGGWAWRHRAAWAPSGFAVLAFTVTTVVHVIAPWMAWVLAAATLAPAAGLWWARHKRPEVFGERPARVLTLAGLTTAALGWAAGTVHFGPLTEQLAWLWLLLAAAAQVFWIVVRRSN